MNSRWGQVWAAVPACFLAGGLYGWSALIAPLQAELGVSTAQTGLVFSLAIVCFTGAVIGAPHIMPNLAPLRRVATFGIAAALALVLAINATSYTMFVLWFSGGFGTLSGAIYIASITISAQSSVHRQATPLMVASFGTGGAVFGPLWRTLGESWGLDAIWPLVAGLVVASSISWLPQQPKTGHMTEPAQPTEGPSPPKRILVLVWITFAFGSFGGLMVLGLAAKMMEVAGASVGLASLTLAGVAIGNTGGRLSVAGMTMIYAPLMAVFISLAVGFSGLALILLVPTAGALAVGLCAVAAGYGVMASAIPTFVRTAYGPARFQPTFAITFIAWGIAGFFAPWIGGALFDQSGTFDGAAMLATATTLACVGTAVALHRSLRAHRD